MRSPARGLLAATGAAASGAAVCAAVLWTPPAGTGGAPPGGLAEAPADAPAVVRTAENAPSSDCAPCHEQELERWRASYHSSMTRWARADSVQAPWGGSLSLDEQRVELWKEGQQLWVALPDPDQGPRGSWRAPAGTAPARVQRQVVMVTGSHHYEVFWVRGARGNELWQLPFVYHLGERRFLPRRSVFLQPPNAPPHQARWNSNCIQCHAVGGEPRHDQASDRFDSRVTELAIGCEACHGPAGEHVERSRRAASWVGWLERLTGGGESPAEAIVDPQALGSAQSSELCGQCHAYFLPNSPDQWWDTGLARDRPPRAPLRASRHVLDYERDRDELGEALSTTFDSIFHADGTVRVGGREYNGLIRSACYERGVGERKLGCLSCHRMHGERPDAQLRPAARDGSVCSECHDPARFAAASHHRHGPEVGARCMDCHMPHTAYALLEGQRSHRITRPSPARTLQRGVPNACNLCHLARSARWAAAWVDHWYAQQPRPVESLETELSQTAVELLSGDAALRALAAHALGQSQGRPGWGQPWQAQLLVEALEDPYDAVRFIAGKSLARQPGFAGFEYDYLAPPAARRQSRARALQRARARAHDASLELLPEASLQPLRDARDERPVLIAE